MAISVDASPPPKNHIATLKKVGYSFTSAVGDIVDNSIAAQSSRVDFEFLPLAEGPTLVISDDGWGMSPQELQDSMVIGCKGPSDERQGGDLGRFGSGLKTASFSQAGVLTVASKTSSSPIISAARWDVDLVEAENKWLLQILEQDDLEKLSYLESLERAESGTIVCWSNLSCVELDENARSISDQVARLCKELHVYLGKYFHRFLVGKNKVEMFINGASVVPLDPFMRQINGYEEGPETSLRSKQGQIKIRAHILPRFNQMSSEQIEAYGGNRNITKKQGLYIYRDKRLIVEGSWLGLAPAKERSNLARIQIDIPANMDHEWSTDLKKSSLKLPPKVRATLKRIMGSPIKRSASVHAYVGGRETNNPYWNVRENKLNDTVSYEVNAKHSDLDTILELLPISTRSILGRYLSSISNNIPINHIYSTMSTSPKSIDQDDVEASLLAALEAYNE